MQVGLNRRCARSAQVKRNGATLALITLGSWSSAAGAAEISVRQLQGDSYELTLTNDVVLDESVARGYLSEAAVSLCKGLSPKLGRYRFESKEALGAGLLSRERPSYRFVQEVSCVPHSQSVLLQRQPTVAAPEELEQVREEVKKMSEAYFRLLAAKRFSEAYSRISEAALGTDKATWIREKRTFQMLAGEPQSISIVKITVYDNPPEAPEPGLYVAADFQNAYKSVPYECGYLMWYRLADGTYTITRLETGHVTSETLKSIPQSQRPELLRRLRCIAP
jgi:hypothetical protein